VADQPIPRGIIDTSVVIALEHVAARDLPAELAVSAVTLTELAAGPTRHPTRRSAPGDRTDCSAHEASLEPLPVDANVARAYGRSYAAVSGAGRKIAGRGAAVRAEDVAPKGSKPAV
jgi:predicted nucleic acid-binding protein